MVFLLLLLMVVVVSFLFPRKIFVSLEPRHSYSKILFWNLEQTSLQTLRSWVININISLNCNTFILRCHHLFFCLQNVIVCSKSPHKTEKLCSSQLIVKTILTMQKLFPLVYRNLGKQVFVALKTDKNSTGKVYHLKIRWYNIYPGVMKFPIWKITLY